MTRANAGQSWGHVSRNLGRIREQIAAAAERAGRDAAEIQLVAVTKSVPVEGIWAAIEAGQTVFGENRVQEVLPKVEALRNAGVLFHFIGHLQTNKAKRVTELDMIESVDSERLARALERHLRRPQPVLLEVNVSGEESKWGFAPHELSDALESIRELANVQVEGLMTVAPLAADPEDLRPLFRRLRELGDEAELPTLSMGMTNDFSVAIEEGATIVRIGRAIFGDR